MLKIRRLLALCAVVSGLSPAVLSHAPAVNAQTVKYKTVTSGGTVSQRRVEGGVKVEHKLPQQTIDNIGPPMNQSEKIIEGHDRLPGAIAAPGI